ncbi:AAA family ATPase [Devosia sp. Leaf420]|uniref:AAA family ATPase n=1 Tax=Devosia sp. Leaf420 TaxID=1736374 RepID=UPI0007822A80|nr:AAA family ATPase [Devosia sp. Leaf420]
MTIKANDRHDEETSDEPNEACPETAITLLPRLALEQAAGLDAIAKIKHGGVQCIVVKVPDGSWVDPVARHLRSFTTFSGKITAREKVKRREDDRTSEISVQLACGAKVFGVSQDPKEMLPSIMLASHDLWVEIAQPSAEILEMVIETITGEGVDLSDLSFDDVSFDEFATSLRLGSTGQDCADRLKAIVDRKQTEKRRPIPAVPVQDLIGYGPAKEWATNLIQDLSAWRRGETDFDALESRIVLGGPPGTGKTSFARSVAQSAGIPLFDTSAAAWFLNSSGNLDGVIKQMDSVFAAARAEAPACILIDEIDSVPDRSTLSNRGRDWWLPVIAHLLTLLDGATEANRNLIIIGATNYPERLDEALIRPGRLSRVVQIGFPSTEEVELILRQHLKDDLQNTDLGLFATMMANATGAMVADAVKRARALARRSGSRMTSDDLMSIVAPPEDRPLQMLRRIATHEAGHAVITHVIGSGVLRSVSLIQSGAAGGQVTFEQHDIVATRDQIEKRVVTLLAGRSAEKILLGSIGTGSGGHPDSDLGRATTLIASLQASQGLGDTLAFRGEPEEMGMLLRMNGSLFASVEADLKELHERTDAVVVQNAELITAVADALLEKRFLKREEFLDVIKQEMRHGG